MEIEKINLNSSEKNSQEPNSSETVDKKTGGGKKKFVVLGVIIVFLLWVILGVVIPGKGVLANGFLAVNSLRAAYSAIKQQNIVQASEELKKAHENLLVTQKSLKFISYNKYIPLIGGYFGDLEHFVKGGVYAVEAAQIAVDSIVPYADLLGFKGQGSFVLGSAEDRIRTAVVTLDKVTPKISDIQGKFTLFRGEIDQVSPNRYLDLGDKFKMKSQIKEVKTVVDQLDTFISEAKPLVEVLPDLLGSKKEVKYLVLFQNDKELRASGGFLTAFAIFRIDKGIIHVDRADDIYALDNSLRKREKAPEPILKYLPKVTTFNLRDSNLSPDFVESMKTFNSMYENSGGKTAINGIIALDTHVLLSTIKILDDKVDAAGLTFNTQLDKRCNCPQAIYVLEDNISRPVGYVRAGRKDLIGLLMYSIMQKALSSSPKIYWGPLIQQGISEINEKHILFYLFDENAQKGLEALNAGGRIKSPDGDYLHINDTNFGGQKSNMYTKHNVVQNIEKQGDGSLVKTINITYTNPEPPSDCDLERGGLCLNAELRNWLRIYVPKGSQLLESQGSEVEVTTGEDLGKTVFEGFLKVRPQGKATFTIKYKLPMKADGKGLPLLIQKQPGTDGHEYSVKVNGQEVEKFKLTADKELKLKL